MDQQYLKKEKWNSIIICYRKNESAIFKEEK
jgi:hypothetical protein